MQLPSRVARIFATLLCLLAAQSVSAEDAQMSVKARVEPGSIAVGEKALLVVEIDVPKGFHLWSLDPGQGPQALTMNLTPEGVMTFDGPWHGAAPKLYFDRGFQRELGMYEGSLRFERIVELKKAAEASLVVRGQICTDEVCVGQKQDVKLPFTVAAAGVDRPEIALAGVALSERGAAAKLGPAKPDDDLKKAQQEGVLAFLLIAFLAGLGALATPCVFPAIPLTISFFTKYSQESFGRGARLAAVYALTMVATFTLAGVAISALFGATGVQQFAAHPIFNLILAAVLVFFALNLLGMFEIGVPAFVLSFVNTLETKYGRAAQASTAGAKRSGLSDYVVVAVAAVTATTVFFTCTVALVGVVLVQAALGEWFWPTIGMLAFAAAFALPFFLLAMFPQAAQRLRGKSGGWLTATRVTLGFLEMAAAMKFFSNADLTWQLGLLTREVVLAIWIPLFALMGLYFIRKVKFGEEIPGDSEHVSVGRVMAATGAFALSIYLAAGLFASRPFGGWVDGWLPPLGYGASSQMAAGGGGGGAPRGVFDWIHDLAKGREVAQSKGTLVFVNYTGYTCTNCRYMESGVFPRPEIAVLLNKMTLVELYTDGSEPEHDRNREDQVARFGTAALPFYTVEWPDGTVISTFASSTNDPEEFRRFLAEALEKAGAIPSGPAIAQAKPIQLGTRGLYDGKPLAAVIPGRWNLINFWASWCAPCIEELRDFLAVEGKRFEERGGHFATVAVEYDPDGVASAREIMKTLALDPTSVLMLPADDSAGVIDPRLEFDGGALPYTVLIAPTGEVVWKHQQKLDKKMLEEKLVCYAGPEPKVVSSSKDWLARKCS